MSKFNKKTVAEPVNNLAGSKAYKESARLALVSLLLTSFGDDQFYRTSSQTFDELKRLIKLCKPEFVAKSLIYARKAFGMRTITHVGASELSAYASGEDWAARFYAHIVARPDDMTEILSYHKAQGYKVTNALKKGFAEAFTHFDVYTLAKYQGKGKGFSLRDAARIAHPVPAYSAQANAFKALLDGTLVNTDTWEARISAAGSDRLKRAAVWADLISRKKLGYLALLRNLRNIFQDAPEVMYGALNILKDKDLIAKAKIFPFQFNTAFDAIAALPPSKEQRRILQDIQEAFEISVSNVPVFEGDTLVVLDVSNSMWTTPDHKAAKIGSQFTACLAKANNADIITFDEIARYVVYNPADTMFTISTKLRFNGTSTQFKQIFHTMGKCPYDRIILLSDMQATDDVPTVINCGGGASFRKLFQEYKEKCERDTKLYSFDLAGYGSMQTLQSDTFALAGFSDKVFDIMKALDEDPNALLTAVENVQL